MKEITQLAERLRARNLKATSKRLEVLSIISAYKKAIPFSEIQRTLQGMDRVTLYRTIQALTENGIIHKALVDENDTFFAMCSTGCTSETHDHKHIHFKCTTCKAVTCVQASSAISLSIPGHIIEAFEIEATGVCVSCAD